MRQNDHMTPPTRTNAVGHCMNSSRDAVGSVAVDGKDETGVPRLLRKPGEVRDLEGGGSRGTGTAFEVQAWYEALGLGGLGPSERSHGKSAQRPAVDRRGSGANPAVHITLPQSYLDRVRELRQAFARAGDETNVGERVLEDFAAVDTGLAEALVDAEAAVVALLQKAGPTNPAPSLKMVEVAEGVGRLLVGMRSRIEGSLAAAASLRARRLSLTRGIDGK
jgi:hypothetical protein